MRVFSLIKDLWWMLIPLVLCIVGVFIKVLLPYGFGITIVVLILWMIRMNSEAKKVVPIPIKFPRVLWFFLLASLFLSLISLQYSLRDMSAVMVRSSPFTTPTVPILTIALIASIMVFIFLYKTFSKYKPKIPAFKIGGGFTFLSITLFFLAFRGLYQHYPDFKYLVFSGMILAGISVFSMMLMVLFSLKPEDPTKKAVYRCFAIGMSSLIGSIIIFVAGELVGFLLQDILSLTKSGWIISI